MSISWLVIYVTEQSNKGVILMFNRYIQKKLKIEAKVRCNHIFILGSVIMQKTDYSPITCMFIVHKRSSLNKFNR